MTVLGKTSAAVFSLASALAYASGDSGTGAVGEMNLSGSQFLMLVGGVAAVALVLWLVGKIVSK